MATFESVFLITSSLPFLDQYSESFLNTNTEKFRRNFFPFDVQFRFSVSSISLPLFDGFFFVFAGLLQEDSNVSYTMFWLRSDLFQ